MFWFFLFWWTHQNQGMLASANRKDVKRQNKCGRPLSPKRLRQADTQLIKVARFYNNLSEWIHSEPLWRMPHINGDDFRARDRPLVAGCSIAISCLFMSADGVQTKEHAGRGQTSATLLFLFLKKVQRLELSIFETQRQKTQSASTTELSSLWAPVCDLCTHFLPYVHQRRDYGLSIQQNTVLKVRCG